MMPLFHDWLVVLLNLLGDGPILQPFPSSVSAGLFNINLDPHTTHATVTVVLQELPQDL